MTHIMMMMETVSGVPWYWRQHDRNKPAIGKKEEKQSTLFLRKNLGVSVISERNL